MSPALWAEYFLDCFAFRDDPDKHSEATVTYKLTPHQMVRISDVTIPGDHREVDQEVVSQLAESIGRNGLLHPIVVRRREAGVFFGKKLEEKILLVAGLQRLKGAELAGLKEIPAIFLEGDAGDARLVTIEENLLRKDLTALERAEELVEWMGIAKELEVSGHNVRNPKGGRPKGGTAKLARDLPISGKTEEARRKTAERSKKIVGLTPKAKAAAIKAGLDDSQSMLLQIANETPQAQIKKVGELAARITEKGGNKHSRRKAKTKENTQKGTVKKSLSAAEKKVLADLCKKWDEADKLKRAFIKASPNVRDQFLAKICEE